MTGEIDPVSGTHRWNPYAVGQKRYGAGQSSAARTGQISANGMRGYAERDQALRLTKGVRAPKPVDGKNLQQAATRAALARRYGRPYPGTTTNTGV